MGKFDLNAILNDLGVKTAQGFGSAASTPAPPSDTSDPQLTPIIPISEPEAPPTDAAPDAPSPAETAPAEPENTPRRRAVDTKHSVDLAEQAFTHVPAVPSGQRMFLTKLEVENETPDPAVPVPPREASESHVGPAMVQIQSEHAEVRRPLERILLDSGAASEAQYQTAQQIVKSTPGKRLSEALIEQGCDEKKVQAAVAESLGLAFETIDLAKGLDGGFDGKLAQRLGVDFCKSHGVIPLRLDGPVTIIGMIHPEDLFVVDEVRRRLGISVTRSVVITGFDLRGAAEVMGEGESAANSNMDVDALLSEVSESDVQVEKKTEQETDLEKLGEDSPVIKYVNYIIQNAVKEGASDIHIEPGDKKIRVRFRIDGELYEMMQPPPSLAAAITSRLKIMANLDISERRLPQDGRIRCIIAGRKLDLRVSTLPVSYGEKVVMRILDTKSINVTLDQLGFDPDVMSMWKTQIEAPHGIVLVTGPTGSGKTTTLYSSLKALDKNSMNISTVEDPVEYHLDGVTQCQTHEKIGMTFAKALKSLLRQDPDVILLGEIRDLETAVTAVQAALTGHLVLSTLHTNDAPSSITRLVNIGIEPFLIGAALNAVLAQRLVRRLCKECKHQGQANESLADFLTIQGLPADEVWMPKGCDKCRKSGYSGRLGIYELLVIDDQLRDIVARNPNVSELRRLCTERGMVNLRADGLKKAIKGFTSVEEVLRITESTI